MSNQISIQTITLPSWLKEISPQPKIYLKRLLKSSAFVKMQEYKKKLQIYEIKYRTQFDEFEKKVKSLNKENFEMWDDYIIWQGLNKAYEKWQKRYLSF